MRAAYAELTVTDLAASERFYVDLLAPSGERANRRRAALLPEMELLLFAIGILVMDRWVEREEKYWSSSLALAGAIFSALTLLMLQARIHSTGDFTAFQETIVVDSYFLVFAALSVAATVMVILLSINDPAMRDVSPGRFYALLLLACVGAMLMISAAGLLVIFLALEIAAVGAYFLAATPRFRKRSAPAALKFMFASALGSALLAYGFSLLYGLSASTNISQIATTLNHRQKLAAAIDTSRQPGVHAAQMYELIQRRLPEALHWHPFILQLLPIAALCLFLAGMVLKLAATRLGPRPKKPPGSSRHPPPCTSRGRLRPPPSPCWSPAAHHFWRLPTHLVLHLRRRGRRHDRARHLRHFVGPASRLALARAFAGSESGSGFSPGPRSARWATSFSAWSLPIRRQ